MISGVTRIAIKYPRGSKFSRVCTVHLTLSYRPTSTITIYSDFVDPYGNPGKAGTEYNDKVCMNIVYYNIMLYL